MPLIDQPSILLSFDLEEFDIPEEFEQTVPPEEQIAVSTAGLDRLLPVLDELDIPATFFTTAVYAEAEPARMKKIAERHEVGSHTVAHSRFHNDDLAESRQRLEKVTDQPCLGFRRPRLQATDSKLLLEAGYRYNSSENPIYLPGRYNNFFKRRTAYLDGELLNIPISASPIFRLPLFWLAVKNFPLPLTKLISRWTLRSDGYLNIFFHPWEFADIGSYELPGYVKGVAGERMLELLATYLKFLQARAGFVTFAQFDELARQRL